MPPTMAALRTASVCALWGLLLLKIIMEEEKSQLHYGTTVITKTVESRANQVHTTRRYKRQKTYQSYRCVLLSDWIEATNQTCRRWTDDTDTKSPH